MLALFPGSRAQEIDRHLDDFVGAMLELAETKPEELEEAPTHAPIRRLDETRAARQLKARW